MPRRGGPVPIAISDEQLALQASIRDWAKRADTLALVRRLEPGSAPAEWEDCWPALAGLGVFSIALPVEVGGAGGSVADLAAAIEQLTCVLAPGPVMPTALAGLVLAGAVPAGGAVPDGVLGGPPATRVRDLAATLYAAEAAAVAGYCCDAAAAYARTRHQFGRPIGSFQAVKHLCAGMLCRAERAAALAWDAARAADEAPDEHPLATAAAAALALDAAVDNAKDCIQVLGGIGFTWEHDAHLYLRRALALRQLLGGSARWRARAAELALAGARRRLGTGPGGTDIAAIALAGRSAAAAIAALPPQDQRAALADAG